MKKLCQFAFLAAIFCVPLAHSRVIYEQTELPKRILSSFVVWLLAISWVLVRQKNTRKLPTIFGLGAVILLWQLAIWPFAVQPSQSIGIILMTFESLAWLWLAFELLDTKRMRLWATLMLVASGFTASVLGLIQFERLFPSAFPGGMQAFGDNLTRWLAQTGVWSVPSSALAQTDAPGSFFGHTNIAAEFVVLGLTGLLVLSWATFWKSIQQKSWTVFFKSVCGLSVAAVLGLFVLRTGSRSAMAAAMIAFAAAWFHIMIHDVVHRPIGGRRGLHVLSHALLLLLLLGSAYFVMNKIHSSPRSGQEQVTLWERFRSSFDFDETTVRERRVLWENTAAMAQENPVLGVGPGNFTIAYPEYSAARMKHADGRFTLRRRPTRPHNEYVNFLAENGVFGALLATFMFLAFFVPFMKRRNAFKAAVDLEDGLALSCISMVIAFLITALFGFPWEQTGARVSFIVVLGIGIRLGLNETNKVGWSGPRGLVWAGVFLCIFVLSAAHYRASYQASKSIAQLSSEPTSPTEDLYLKRLRSIDQSIRRVPARADYHLLRGNLCRRLGLLTEAEASFNDALNREPSLANAWLGLAQVRQATGRPQAAKGAVKRALALQPNEPQILISAGQIYEGTGDRRSAILALKKAIELAPYGEDRITALLALSRLHSVIGNKPTSAFLLSQAEAMDNTHPAFLETKAYFLERHQPKSNACFEAWKAYALVNPNHAEAQLRLCENWLQRGRYPEALLASELAFAADQRLLIALYRRAQAQVGLEQLREARDTTFECMKRSSRPGAKDMSLYSRCLKLVTQIEERARKDGLIKKDSPEK